MKTVSKTDIPPVFKNGDPREVEAQTYMCLIILDIEFVIGALSIYLKHQNQAYFYFFGFGAALLVITCYMMYRVFEQSGQP